MTEFPAHVAVLVVSYGSPSLLAENLTPLTRAVPELSCVVVDNPTTAANRDAARQLAQAEGWAFLEPDQNGGFGAGMNLAAARALADGAEVLVLLNPDAVISPEDLQRLVEGTDPMTIAGPVIVDDEGTVVSDGMVCALADGSMRSRRSKLPLPPGPVQRWLSGACLSVGAPLWRLLGGFDESYFLYWEEIDLAARAEALGGKLRLVRDARAVHMEGGTQERETTSRAKSNTYYYYNTRNRAMYAQHCLPASTQLRWALSAPLAAREILLRGGRRQLLASRAPAVATARGLLDGWRILLRSRSAG